MNRSSFLTILALIFFLPFANAQQIALNHLVYQIRDPATDAQHFRKALEKIGEHLARDVLEELGLKEVQVSTLTEGVASHFLLDEQPVLVTILRAGVPLSQGVQKIFPNAHTGFIAMSRNEETLLAKVEYIALPEIHGKCVIITDTMIATGGSILDAISIVERYGPKKIFVIGAIASQPGIERIRQYDPSIKVFAAAIDPTLNEKGYIIPGLGDAGDRSYGPKFENGLK